MKILRVVAMLGLVSFSAQAFAVDLVVSLWGLGMYGAPIGVALDKGFFDKHGVHVTGVSGSTGGGTTIRNLLASDVPYGEVAVAAVVAAVQQGIPLTIVNGGVISLEDMVWITRADSPIKSLSELKGKTLAYSQPKSVTDMVSILMLEKAGVFKEVKRVAIGGVSNGLVALREGSVDVAFIFDPLYSQKIVDGEHYNILARSTSFVPHFTQSVGVVETNYLRSHPDQIKAIIAARCEGVRYILKNPQDAAQALARAYKLPATVTKSAIEHVLASKTPYWSHAALDYEGMDTILSAMRRVKAIGDAPFEWSKIVDERYISADCNKK